MRAAIYARVSTKDQHCEMQLTELRDQARRMGWEIVVEYIEKISTRKRRPELELCLAGAKKRKFDVLLCWKLDRFGRSVKELLANVEALDLAGIRFLCDKIDTDKRDPVSRLTLTILGAVAEFERDLIKERCSAGRQEYERVYAAGGIGPKSEGKRESRSQKNLPPGRPRKIFRRDEAQTLRDRGFSWRSIARQLGVSTTTVHDALSH